MTIFKRLYRYWDDNFKKIIPVQFDNFYKIIPVCKAQKRILHTGYPRLQSDSKNTNYRIRGSYAKAVYLRNRKLTCDHFLESLNGMSMNDIKNVKTKTAQMGIRILFMINKHFHTIRYCYNYLRLYSITLLLRFGHRRAPLGPPFWAPCWGLFGDHSCRDHAASHPRTE